MIAIETALAHHAAGRFAEAEAIYRLLLAENPRHAEALHLLGVMAHQQGRPGAAADLIRQAIALDDGQAVFHNNLGTVLLVLGETDAALAALMRALALVPDYPEALNNLGNALRTAGRLDEAGARYRDALRLKPDYPEGWYNFGNVLQAQGRLEQAVEVYRQALALKPAYPDALNNLGGALLALGRSEAAVAAYAEAVERQPGSARLLNNLANALKSAGDTERAVACYRQSLALEPNNPAVVNNLANALQRQGRLDAAETAYRQALMLRPAYPEALSNLGNVLQRKEKTEEAIACYRQSLGIAPDAPATLHNLATALKRRNKLGEAAALFRRALALDPDYAEALSGLGSVLQAMGKLEEAIPFQRRALALKPDFPEALNHLLFALNSLPDIAGAALRRATEAATAAWGQPAPRPAFDPGAGIRPLRIGYVSADFRNHPVGYFLAGVLGQHDPAAVEIFCYDNSSVPDDMTRRLRGIVPRWRDIATLDDAGAADLIRRDGIDILVDLSGHTAFHRLTLFLRRPAPLQLTWLGYFGTTGLAAIDHILADATVVPPGAEADYSEAVYRLPGCYLCFDGGAIDVPVAPPPVLRNGFVTFGCFNRHDKITAPVIALWAALLGRLPEARLILKNASLADAGVRDEVVSRFALFGIAGARLDLEGPTPRRDYLAAYGRIDIALDPFPFGGGTTTAETLWMGVPLVVLLGRTWPGRISASMLRRVGRDAWIAETEAEYLRIALDLASDIPALAASRAGLRPRVAAGLCDGAGFARALEAAYRSLWDEAARAAP